MQVFKAALKILFRNPVYILVYVVGLSFMGVAMGMSYAVDETSEFARAEVDYAVIDEDGGAIARGLEDFLATQGTRVAVEDAGMALQDAIAKGAVDYALIVPEGYTDAFVAAAKDGEPAPEIDVVYSYYSAVGALVDARVADFMGILRTYIAASAVPEGALATEDMLAMEDMLHDLPATGEGISDSFAALFANLAADDAAAVQDEAASDAAISIDAAVEAALSAASKDVPVEVVRTTDAVDASATYAFYLQFGSYGLFASIIACCGMLIATLNRTDVRRRNLLSPISTLSYSLQTALACLVMALVAWGWTFALGIVVFPDSIAATGVLGVALEGCVLFAFALVPLGLAYLIGQFGVGTGAINAIGNIAGLVVSFLGGAWISLELVPEAVRTVAHFLPGYWFTSAVTSASRVTTGTWDELAPIVGSIGILVLFAAVFFLAGMIAGRTRVQTDEGAGATMAVAV